MKLPFRGASRRQGDGTIPVRYLQPEILLSAYAQGIFPMAVERRIRWFCPDPRAILPLDAFRLPRSLRQACRNAGYQIRVNGSFAAVVRACADRAEGTWISREIFDAYVKLHELGFAHSVEAWHDGLLAGGLYGVALGGAFFGESMFHVRRDASKVALAALVDRMRRRGYSLLDVQFSTPHLEQFGVVEIPRSAYLERLASALELRCVFAAPDEPPQAPLHADSPLLAERKNPRGRADGG